MKKKISDYSHEELLKLSTDELSRLFDIEREDEDKKRINFESNEYPKFSFEEKVKFWSGNLHRQMRWQVESGLDPYAIYDEQWYKEVKITEPNIDLIMNEVFAKHWSSTGGKWEKEEYYKRINKPF
jgi:hypothetical protein